MAAQLPSSSKAISTSIVKSGVKSGGAAGGDDGLPPALLEFQSPSAAVAAIRVPFVAKQVSWMLCLMVALILVIISVIPIDTVITATGRIVSSEPTLVVQPLQTAIVRKINVKPGDVVRKGDVLAVLDPTFATADLAALQSQTHTLEADVARLQAETARTPFTYTGTDPVWMLELSLYTQRQTQYQSTMENYNQKVAGLEATVTRAKADAQGYRDRLAVAVDMERIRRELEKLQVGATVQTLQAVDMRLEMARAVQNALNTAASSQGDLEAMRSERAAFDQQWRADASQKLSDQSVALHNAQEAFNKAQLVQQLVELKAQQDAVVLSMAKLSVGSVMQSGDQFFVMSPLGADTVVNAYLPGTYSGYVKLGDPTTIKFDTFPYVRHGTASGVVTNITDDSFVPADSSPRMGTMAAPAPPPTSVPFFMVTSSVDATHLRGVRPDFKPTPGLTIAMDIKVGKNTVMSYILTRVIPLADQAFREPN